MKRVHILLAVACLFGGMPQANALESLRTERFVLDNGLRVVVLRHPRAPIVTHMLWFAAGGADEPKGKSGVAHFLEHMMFKGTPKYPDDSYTKIVERMGGQHNAFTADDFTAYYATVSKEHLEELMALEADRVQHIAPPKNSYASENKVVLEERRMRIDNDVSTRLAEVLDAKLFAPHPYAVPLIGWAKEIEKLGEKDVLDFYHQHYFPENAILLVVGDVDAEQVHKLAVKYYASWSANENADKHNARKWQDPQLDKVYKPIETRDKIVKQPQWQRQYLAPSLGYGEKAQVFPLIVLSDMLCNGNSSILYRALVVEQKIASSVGCGYNPFARGPSQLQMEIIPAPNVTMAQVSQAYEKVIATFLKDKSQQDDRGLAIAKNRLKVEAIYARDGVSGMAFILGQLLMNGYDIDFFNAWPDKISAVTWEEIVHAGTKTLQQSPFITGLISPENKNIRKKTVH